MDNQLKKFCALMFVASGLLLTAVKADPPAGWPRFGVVTWSDEVGLDAVFLTGDDTTAALTKMEGDTFNPLSMGGGPGPDGNCVFATYEAGSTIAMYADAYNALDGGTEACLIVRDTVGMTDYYGNYTEVYSVFQGQYWAGWLYYDTTESFTWDRHCSGGNPTFTNFINIVKVDAFPLGAGLVPAVLDNPANSLVDLDAMYCPNNNTLYVSNTDVGGNPVTWDATTVNKVSYRTGPIPMSVHYHWWTANGKTNNDGSQFGWLVTDDPPNPSGYTN